VVKSFAVCPLEFLQSRRTPSCRYFLNISGKFAEAASITLLFPQLSISYQCRPALIKSWTIYTWPLKDAQWRGFGLISLVDPITTVRYSGFTSRYCWAALLEIINLTILVNPRQQAHIKPVHFFLLFSKCYSVYIHSWCRPFSWDNAKPLHINSFSHKRWVFHWEPFCFFQ